MEDVLVVGGEAGVVGGGIRTHEDIAEEGFGECFELAGYDVVKV